jgi:cytochrome c oxidase assembly protein subunit 15
MFTMQSTVTSNSGAGKWPHRVACCLVGVTAVLLAFGAMVTTYEAAMAVPDWPATYGHNMFLFPWGEWFFGPWDLFLEHGHRMLGALVGLLTLVLVVSAWWTGQPFAVKALAGAALLLVLVQGLLGGLRVLLDDKTVAKVHACTGPLFFAVAVAIATLTSRWAARRALRSDHRLTTQGWLAVGLMVAAYVQLVAGAQLRHLDATVGPATFRWLVVLHLFGAAVVTLFSLIVAAGAFGWVGQGDEPACVAQRRWSAGLVALIAGQLALGCAAWIVSWGLPLGLLPDAVAAALPEPATVVVARSGVSALIVTGHVLLGMMILAASVVLCLVSGGLPQPVVVRLAPGRRALA